MISHKNSFCNISATINGTTWLYWFLCLLHRETICLVYFCPESFTETCTSLKKSSGIFRQNPLEVPVKKLNLKKNFTTHEILHKWLLGFPVRLFLPNYRSLFVSYMADIFVFLYTFVKSISFRFYCSWDGKRKKNMS